MTTKKNLVKQVLMSTLTAGIFSFGFAFTACSDDDVMNDNGQAQVAAETLKQANDLKNLPNNEYSFPLEVKNDGQWRIGFGYDDDGQICYAYPKSGNGNATVKVYVSKNYTGNERTNDMYIINTLSGDTLQTMTITQQAGGGTRADVAETGNRIYGAGYGYNIVTGKMSQAPLVMTSAAIEEKVLVTGGVEADYHVREYTGSCFSQLCNNLKAEASFEGKKGGFEGEINAKFDMKNFQETNKDYVMSRIDVVINKSHFEADCQSIMGEWMTDQAYDAINGLPTTVTSKSGRKRTVDSQYPSTREGFKKLINEFGTHMLRSCKLGGRMTYATTIDLSKVEDEYNLNAYAKCGYENKIIKVSASVSDSLTAKFKTNQKAINTRLFLTGGSKESSGNLKMEDSDKNMEAWVKSLQDGTNTMVVDLPEADLVPLYELVNDAEAPGRAALLKEYMESGQMEADFSEPQTSTAQQMGIIPHIKNISKMFSNDLNDQGTLIKDLYVGGTLVARVCSEFIPKFSMTERSIVIYPVCNNWAKYNMGYFVGNKAWKPQYVCFLDNGTFVNHAAPNTTAGAQDELYMSGSTFFSPNDPMLKTATESKPEVTVKNAYMETKSWNETNGQFIYNKPIVKIFNRIWSRSRYGEEIGDNAGWYRAEHFEKFTVENWKMATTEDFNNLFNGLKNANISLPAQYMSNVNGGKDLTGFNIEFNKGWCYGNATHGKNGNRMLYVTASRDNKGKYSNYKIVEFDQNGLGHISSLGFDTDEHAMFVRMVQPLKAQIAK
jgi:hypothetical protein